MYFASSLHIYSAAYNIKVTTITEMKSAPYIEMAQY